MKKLKSDEKGSKMRSKNRILGLGLVAAAAIGAGSMYYQRCYSEKIADDAVSASTTDKAVNNEITKATLPTGCGHNHHAKTEVKEISSVTISDGKEILTAAVGDEYEIFFGDALTVKGKVNMNKEVAGGRKAIGMTLDEKGSYLYWLQSPDGGVIGNVVVKHDDANEVYRFKNKQGAWSIESLPFSSYICAHGETDDTVGTLKAVSYGKVKALAEGEAPEIPILNSLPGAESVMYLDFDGELVSGTRWNANLGGRDINALAPNLTVDEIKQIWEEAAEDMRPFKMNVTTDRAVFDAAPVGKRMQVIQTPTKDAEPSAGGVAYLESFWDGSVDPCWNFNLGTSDSTSSHETGHTFGLSHDGDPDGSAYHHGNGTWGPIMGAPFGCPTITWCKGDYPGANNKEDDIAIIDRNSANFRKDEYGNTNEDAFSLSATEGSDSIEIESVILKPEDVDVFVFRTRGGALNLKADEIVSKPNMINMKLMMSLYDEEGVEVDRFEGTGLSANLNKVLEAGTYYLHIEGVGEGSPDASGFTDYGSIGGYKLTGKIANLGDSSLRLSEDSHEFDGKGGEHSFNVLTEFTWSWSSNVNWITSSEAKSQTGNQKFSYSVGVNPTTDVRKGVITFQAEGSTVKFTVTQLGGEARLKISESEKNLNSLARTLQFEVESNASWTWSKKVDWIKSRELKEQRGNQAFTYSVDVNPSDTSRTGVITLSSGDTTVTYTVTQSAADVIDLGSIQRPSQPATPPSAETVPVSSASVGNYSGFIQLDSDKAPMGFFKKIKVTSKGGLSAKMVVGKATYSLKGLFDANGRFVSTVTPKSGSPAQVDLQLVKTKKGSLKIAGSVKVGSKSGDVIVVKSGQTSKIAGNYTVLIVADTEALAKSLGYGHALMQVTSQGTAKLKGMLGDGNKWTAKCMVSTDGEMPFYFNKKGTLSGNARFRDVVDVSDADAKAFWRRSGKSVYVKQNFMASRFRNSGTRLLKGGAYNLPNAQAFVEFETGSDAGSWPLDWGWNNKITHLGPEGIKLKINSKSGQLKGKLPVGGQNWRLNGVLFQKQNIGVGLMTQKGRASRNLIILPVD